MANTPQSRKPFRENDIHKDYRRWLIKYIIISTLLFVALYIAFSIVWGLLLHKLKEELPEDTCTYKTESVFQQVPVVSSSIHVERFHPFVQLFGWFLYVGMVCFSTT